jgi:hypothetical protein
MRTLISLLTIILLVIGVIGVAMGIAAVATAGKAAGAVGIVAALVYGSLPLILGCIALGAAAIVLSIEQATIAQVTAINRGTEVALNEAKLAEHHRKALG